MGDISSVPFDVIDVTVTVVPAQRFLAGKSFIVRCHVTLPLLSIAQERNFCLQIYESKSQ